MSLPKRVQRELEAAEALEAHYQQARSEQATTVAQNVSELVQPPAQPEETPAQPTAPAIASPPAAPAEDFEQKYRTLQGIYTSDVKAMRQQLAVLSEQLQEVSARPAQTPQQAPSLDQKDIETFGEDLIRMVQKYAEGQQAKTDSRLVAIEQQLGMVAQQSRSSSRQSFITALRAAVPDFERINADERWLAWLGEVDGLYGVPRQAALDDAQAKGDVGRVAAFFNAFTRQFSPPAEPPAAPASNLSQQIVPSGVGAPKPTATPPKKFITQKIINDFYRAWTRGDYNGREKEAAALEAEIEVAVAEGRVI